MYAHLRERIQKVSELTAKVKMLEKRMSVMEDENKKKASVVKGGIGAVVKGSKGK